MRGDEQLPTSTDPWTEALTWYVALREAGRQDLTNRLRREWQEWYADAANRSTFEQLARLLADRARYRDRIRLGEEGLAGDQYDLSMPIAAWRKKQARNLAHSERSSARGGWWWLSGGLGVATIVLLLALWPNGFGPWASGAVAAIYQTNVAGIEDVHLRDGSSIILGGQTKLSVTLSPQRRSVRLIEGEAWFKIAHDPNWPFVVAAGDGTITAIGTAFLVTRQSDRVVVTVTDGTVEVSAQPPMWPPLRLVQEFSLGPALPPVPVSRGEELAFADGGEVAPVKPADTRAATAWTHGRLIFDDQPLRYVVETINRYYSRRIVVGASAGALRFSGIILEDDIRDWLNSLQVILPVVAKEQDATVYIRTRRLPATSVQTLSKHRP